MHANMFKYSLWFLWKTQLCGNFHYSQNNGQHKSQLHFGERFQWVGWGVSHGWQVLHLAENHRHSARVYCDSWGFCAVYEPDGCWHAAAFWKRGQRSWDDWKVPEINRLCAAEIEVHTVGERLIFRSRLEFYHLFLGEHVFQQADFYSKQNSGPHLICFHGLPQKQHD